jgi:hypothetical protein
MNCPNREANKKRCPIKENANNILCCACVTKHRRQGDLPICLQAQLFGKGFKILNIFKLIFHQFSSKASSLNCPNREVNKKRCPCPKKQCVNNGLCCECVLKHKRKGDLPACFRMQFLGKAIDTLSEPFKKS